jgi:STE24 endopeptidase
MVSLFGLLAQPIAQCIEARRRNEADHYSLERVNLPDALASALVKTAEYRNPRPTPLEEALFYDHPSVERRVRTAMDWKATHDAR